MPPNRLGNLYVPKDDKYFMEKHKDKVAQVFRVEEKAVWYYFIECDCQECVNRFWNLPPSSFSKKFRKKKMVSLSVKGKYVL